MPVYVDPLANHGWKLGPNCHLIADSIEELHVFAARLGMKPAWYQAESSPHYDLTERRRSAAVRLGAVELDRRALVAKLRELRAARKTVEGVK
jgi:hypothetical protein